MVSIMQDSILTMLATGASPGDTAAALGIAPATLRVHLHRARQHYGARTTAQLIALLQQQSSNKGQAGPGDGARGRDSCSH